ARVAARAATERVVEADDDLPRAERVKQHVLDERLGLDARELGREGNDHGRVDPALGDQLEALGQRDDRLRRRRREHLEGMWVEGADEGTRVELPGAARRDVEDL